MTLECQVEWTVFATVDTQTVVAIKVIIVQENEGPFN